MADKSSPEQIREKLLRVMRAKAVLAEKSRLLQQQADDARRREEVSNHVVSELLDRQRESNFMLHRANSVLHRLQETNLALSSEFTELVKELPAPNSPDWEQRVAKINDLFRKTGELADEVQDEVFRKGGAPEEPSAIAGAQPQSIQSAAPPVAHAEPVVEAEPVPTPEPESVELHQPSPEPVVQAVPVDPPKQPRPNIQHIEAEFTVTNEDSAEGTEYAARMDSLFQKFTSPKQTQPNAARPRVTEDPPEDPAQTLLSGLRSRLSRKPKNQKPGITERKREP